MGWVYHDRRFSPNGLCIVNDKHDRDKAAVVERQEISGRIVDHRLDDATSDTVDGHHNRADEIVNPKYIRIVERFRVQGDIPPPLGIFPACDLSKRHDVAVLVGTRCSDVDWASIGLQATTDVHTFGAVGRQVDDYLASQPMGFTNAADL